MQLICRCLESLPKISINVQYVRLECNVTLYPPSSLFTTLKTAIQSIENITNNNFVELYEPIAIEGHYIMYFAHITNIHTH